MIRYLLQKSFRIHRLHYYSTLYSVRWWRCHWITKIKLLPMYCWEPQNVINSDQMFQSFKSESSHKYNVVLQKVQSPTVNTFFYNKFQPPRFKTIRWRQNNMEHTCSVCGKLTALYALKIFHWHNPSGRTMDLRLTQPLTDMYQEYLLGVTAVGALGWPYHLPVPIVLKSGKLNVLEPSGPVQACNGVALPLHLHALKHNWIQ